MKRNGVIERGGEGLVLFRFAAHRPALFLQKGFRSLLRWMTRCETRHYGESFEKWGATKATPVEYVF